MTSISRESVRNRDRLGSAGGEEYLVYGRVAEEVEAGLAAGRAPDLEAIVARYPTYERQIRELVPALITLEQLGGLESRLQPEQGADSPAEAGTPTSARSASLAGQLGDFRILREIGRGGMGVVYEAEQISLGRRVALKVLPFAAVMDPKHLQRFKNEAMAAAQLDHPNIVHVHYVGCERGVHFYAMQFIDGHTLAEVIRELRRSAGLDGTTEDGGSRIEDGATGEGSALPQSSILDPLSSTRPLAALTTARSTNPREYFRTVARLGIQAAEALEHAHEIGVIHRDIKPSNLLLDVRGNLWITDFGLARFGTDGNLTMTGDLVGTLRYMSPEQALAKRVVVDHRTDIYSLGVTLYELVTLEPAFTGQDRQELLKQIAFDEPRPLRRVAVAVPPELETIVFKAMEKEPRRRYAVAQELADDLRRFVEDKPILARRPSVFDKLVKWSRRHTLVVRTAVAALLLAVIGLSVATWLIAQQRNLAEAQRMRADARGAQARKVVDEMFTQVAEKWLSQQPHMEDLQREFLLKAATAYEDLVREEGEDPDLLYETAEAYSRLGIIHRHLGEREKAELAFDRAIATYKKLLAVRPADPDYQRGVAINMKNRAAVFWDAKQLEDAEQTLRQSIELLETITTQHADDSRAAEELAKTQYNLAVLLAGTARLADAESLVGKSLRVADQLAARVPLSPELTRLQITAVKLRAQILQATERIPDSEEAFKHCQALIDALPPEIAARPEHRLIAAGCLLDLGHLYATTARPREAELQWREAIRLLDGMAGDFPKFFEYRENQIHAYLNLITLQLELDDRPAAAETCRQALKVHPDNPSVHGALARLLADPQVPEIFDVTQASKLATRATELEPDNSANWNTLAIVYYRRGDWNACHSALQKADQIEKGKELVNWFLMAMVHWQLGKPDEAATWFDRANGWMERNKPSNPEWNRIRKEAAALLEVK